MLTHFYYWLLTPMTVCTGWSERHAEIVIRWGNPFTPKSHGMCPTCQDAYDVKIDRELTVWQAICQDPRRI